MQCPTTSVTSSSLYNPSTKTFNTLTNNIWLLTHTTSSQQIQSPNNNISKTPLSFIMNSLLRFHYSLSKHSYPMWLSQPAHIPQNKQNLFWHIKTLTETTVPFKTQWVTLLNTHAISIQNQCWRYPSTWNPRTLVSSKSQLRRCHHRPKG